MKIIKGCVIILTTISLSLTLAACSNGGSNRDREGNVSNSKKMLPIVVTYDKHVSWLGFISQDKTKAMYLDGTVYDYGHNELKQLDNKKFKESVIDMGKDYEPKPRKYESSKANINLTTSPENETEVSEFSFDYLDDNEDLDVSSVKDIVSEPRFNEVLPKEKMMNGQH